MPTWHEATVSGSRQVGAELVELELQVPAAVAQGFHTPGQYHRLQVEGAGDAFFAIASAPGRATFEYLVKRQGQTALALAALSIGSRVQVSELEGAGFPLARARGRNLLLVGTGTGFAPLRSVLEAVRERRAEFGHVRATWGIASPAHLAWPGLLSVWAAAELEVVPVAFGGAPGWAGRVGVVQDVVAAWEVGDALAFLCGHAEMVRDVKALLASRGLPEDRVFLNY